MNKYLLGTTTSSTASVFGELDVGALGRALPQEPSKNLVNAVYSYIQAVRTLGRETVNTEEVAKALSLSPREVERAVAALNSKGVKVIR